MPGRDSMKNICRCCSRRSPSSVRRRSVRSRVWMTSRTTLPQEVVTGTMEWSRTRSSTSSSKRTGSAVLMARSIFSRRESAVPPGSRV